MKKFFWLLALIPITALAASLKGPDDVRFLMNHGYGAVAQLGTQVVDKKEQLLRGTWDVSVEGAVSGSVTLKDVDGKAGVIPKNAIVKDCLIDVITPPTVAQATAAPTISISTGRQDSDLKTAAAFSSYQGLMNCSVNGTVTGSIKMQADVNPVIKIVTTSVSTSQFPSAGKIRVFIKYLLSN